MFYNHCQKEDRQPAPLQFLFATVSVNKRQMPWRVMD